MSRGVWIIISAGVVVAVLASVLLRVSQEQDTVSSFQECADAGNPIMTSHPRQCRTPDGRHFVEDNAVVPTPPLTSTPGTSRDPEEPVFCTADAFQCRDGTWVGRTGPNCEFVCPGLPTE